MSIGASGGLFDLAETSVRLAIGNVGPDRIVERNDVLSNYGNLASQTWKRCIAYIIAVYQDPAAVRIVKSGNKVRQSRLA